jgi:hypothetical protein
MAVFLIGIDDTDNQASPGTGRLARRLSDECARRGLRPLGVTRHQFLVHPAIPYTSHNSGACIALESQDGLPSAEFIHDFVARNSADGSDPGVCLAKASDVPDYIIEFANLATRQVVTMAEAYGRAERASIALRGLGGTSQGVIGALGAVGLRASGNDGRFIDLPGLRELNGCVDVAAFDRIGVAVQYCGCGRAADASSRCETLDWVRPRLVGGKAVLPLEWCEQKNAWLPVDRKQSRPDRDGSRS